MKLSNFLFLGPLCAAFIALPVAAQTNQASASTDAPKASTGIADVLKMLDKNVSPEVIKAYIETSPATFDLTAADLITLKEHNVTDDITVALLKHSTASASAASAPGPTATAAQSAAPVRAYVLNNGAQDMNSYQFFEHYYLMPRTQAYVNDTLGYASVPYGGTFVPYYPPGVYSYGFNAAPGFGGGFGFAAGGRNPFNVGPGLRGGFMIRR